MVGRETRKSRTKKAAPTNDDIPPQAEAEAEVEAPQAPIDPDAHAFKILIATDNHVGYMEKDPIRGNDSYDAFEEILQLAQKNDVDFILLGGDLFHDNKPSRKCMHNTMTLLRQYCLGDRPCRVEFLSDQKENFQNKFGTVNYQDPNFNVGMPVFSIHGNHDDPAGDGSLCALDLLSAAGLVNYFGKQVEVDDIQIKPILLQKGTSKLALYGLGNVRDERLNRTFQKKKVKMFRPREDMNSWFNLMVIHQNRIAHGPNNYIPETFLDDFLNLILWGHEHECLVDPVHNGAQDFWITQPGSSVATSLCEGEAVPKHIAILKIQGNDFQIEKVRLRTVRPFVLDEVVLKEIDGLRPTDQKMVNEFLQDRVEELISTAISEWKELNPGLPDADTPKPLVRLKVEYSGGFTTFNPQRFGQLFVNRVANPKDILQFYRKRAQQIVRDKKKSELVNIDAFLPEKLDNFRVEDLVTEYLNAQNLDILPENELGDAVRMFVEKDDKDAIKDFVDESLKRTRIYLKAQSTTEDDEKIKAEIEKEKKQRFEEFAAESEKKKQRAELLSAARKPTAAGSREQSVSRDNSDAMDVDEVVVNSEDELPPAPTIRKTTTKTSTRGRGTGRGRGRGRGAAAPKTSRTKAKPVDDDDVIDDLDDDFAASIASPTASTTSTTRKRKLPTSISSATQAPATKRTSTTASKGRQSKLNFSQQRPIVLDDDEEDLTFSNFRNSMGGRSAGNGRR